jgi:hypothetical protein
MSKQDNVIPPDVELMLIEDILTQISRSGLSITPIWVSNFLVALKSKPLIILTGPPESAKETLVDGFSTVLIGSDPYQYQTMVGHPWWASQTRDIATYTQTQSRFNTLKLETMIEEARISENQDRFFIAELIKISPGELHEYFTEMAFQLKHGQLMRLPTSHFSEPVPFPLNLSIVGTMDTIKFDWLDRDLLSQATIIDCAPVKSASVIPHGDLTRDPICEKILIQSSIRDPQKAFRKLFIMLRRHPSALLPFLQVKQILQKFRSIYVGNSLVEGIIYLANSWSYTGQGLFDGNRRKNLQIAMDLAITQSFLLPCSEKIAQSDSLQIKLHKILNEQFPKASAFINQLNPA